MTSAAHPDPDNVRGAGGGRGQRNFFIDNSPNDSYAVERFDFSRGPNAILFGNGSLGGVASTMTSRHASTPPSRSFPRRRSWSNFRTTLDVNRPLGERLAVRAALVDAHSEGWRDKQFDKIRAAFLTMSWKLARHTTLRLEGEYGVGTPQPDLLQPGRSTERLGRPHRLQWPRRYAARQRQCPRSHPPRVRLPRCTIHSQA
jgi:outer membrane receptor protein involved in Fe transport